MSLPDGVRVGYVLKRYPRYSETFVVGEICAHEAAGLELDIFSLRPPTDSHFQDAIALVRAPVHYLPFERPNGRAFWEALEAAAAVWPGFWPALEAARGERAPDVCQAAWLAVEVHRRGIRHLHAHFASAATTVARLAARFAGIPFTFTAHAKDLYHESVRPDDLRKKLADAHAVVTVSDYNRDFLVRSFGPAAARVVRVYNGLDLGQFPYDPPRDRRPTIVSVGRLVEKKGFTDLVEACAILRDSGRVFRCEIIGTGPLEPELRRRIRERGLEGRVELTGPRPRVEVARHVRASAAFAAPCVLGADGDRDGLPTVLLEAMALGTPCVSTDVTGIPEAVADGVTGLSVPQRDPAALAAALERLLSDPPLRVRLAEAARKRIEERFDVERNAAELRSIFLEAAREPARLAQEASG